MHSFASIAATGLLALPLVAALPSTKQTLNKRFSGGVTFYAAGLGACGWTNNDGQDIAAISSVNFDRENPCGKEIMVTGKAGSYPVIITDRCADCPENLIDLTPSAFTKIVGSHDIGRDTVTWEFTGKIDPNPAPNYPNLDRSGGKVEESKTTAEAAQPTYVAPPPQNTPVKEEPVKEEPAKKEPVKEEPTPEPVPENPGNNYAQNPEPTTTSEAPEPVVTIVPSSTVVPDAASTPSTTPEYNNNEEEEKKKNGNGNGNGNGQHGQEGKKPKCKSGHKHRKRHGRHARK